MWDVEEAIQTNVKLRQSVGCKRTVNLRYSKVRTSYFQKQESRNTAGWRGVQMLRSGEIEKTDSGGELSALRVVHSSGFKQMDFWRANWVVVIVENGENALILSQGNLLLFFFFFFFFLPFFSFLCTFEQICDVRTFLSFGTLPYIQVLTEDDRKLEGCAVQVMATNWDSLCFREKKRGLCVDQRLSVEYGGIQS